MKQRDTDAAAGPDDHRARRALGLALRALHQRSGRTLRAVEREISISDSTLSRYFRGRAVPSWAVVERICGALGEDPEPLRELWSAAMAEKSGTGFAAPDPSPVPEPVPEPEPEPAVEPAERRGFRLPAVPAKWLWAAAGLIIGLALGAGLTYASDGGARPVRTAAASPSPSPAATGRTCPWKYVVTDGVNDDLLIFDTPNRDSIIARYAPREVFYVPDPPVVVNKMMKTAQGWVAVGDWVQRYQGATCHVGGS